MAEAEEGSALGHGEQHGEVVRVPEPAASRPGGAERVEAAGVVDEVDPEGGAVGGLGHPQHGLEDADDDDLFFDDDE